MSNLIMGLLWLNICMLIFVCVYQLKQIRKLKQDLLRRDIRIRAFEDSLDLQSYSQPHGEFINYRGVDYVRCKCEDCEQVIRNSLNG